MLKHAAMKYLNLTNASISTDSLYWFDFEKWWSDLEELCRSWNDTGTYLYNNIEYELHNQKRRIKLQEFDDSGIPPHKNKQRMSWLRNFQNTTKYKHENIVIRPCYEAIKTSVSNTDVFTFWKNGIQQNFHGIIKVKTKNNVPVYLERGSTHEQHSINGPVIATPTQTTWAHKGEILDVMEWFKRIPPHESRSLARKENYLQACGIASEKRALLKLMYA